MWDWMGLGLDWDWVGQSEGVWIRIGWDWDWIGIGWDIVREFGFFFILIGIANHQIITCIITFKAIEIACARASRCAS